jgi:hypothetical protein
MKVITRKTLAVWLPLAVTVTILFGVVYAVNQQMSRQSANDPQIRVAEDAVHNLENGAALESVVPKEKIDLEKSLATFIIVYNNAHEPVVGSALLGGKIPTPPKGVFEYTDNYTVNRITWQPRSDLRYAVVMYKYVAPQSGYVLVGRSLREVEHRDSLLAMMLAGALGFTLLTSYVLIVILNRIWKQ